jgi:hypothetical protein
MSFLAVGLAALGAAAFAETLVVSDIVAFLLYIRFLLNSEFV